MPVSHSLDKAIFILYALVKSPYQDEGQKNKLSKNIMGYEFTYYDYDS